MSSTREITERLRKEIAEQARIEPAQVRSDAHFVRDLGMSSVDLLCVLAYAEEQFSARFPDDFLGELTSLNDIIEAIAAHQNEEAVGKE
jgi:acyl carrier protein